MTLPAGASFSIASDRQARRLVLHLAGVIDENADLAPLAGARAPVIAVDLRGVRRINSFGVWAWMQAIRSIPRASRLLLTHCAPAVIDQCNMVAQFYGHGAIESFYAPMVCEGCEVHDQVLYDTAECLALGGNLPATPCPSCDGAMAVDDWEEQYLMFLRDAVTAPGP